MSDVQIANAKLTTRLHIVGTRPDGMHLLDAEMVSLSLADDLFFQSGDGLEVEGAPNVPTDRSNLIVTALDLVKMSAYVRLVKRIPASGGLGGGSSNAAAALRWAGRAEVALAAQIGADVPFCLRGGRAEVRGVGEVLKSLPFEVRHYTLLAPPFGVDTAAVYRAFDQLGLPRDENQSNHLEPAAIAVDARLAEWRDRFAEWTGAVPTLAGSGSTWFVEGAFDSPESDELGGARWFNTSTTPELV